MLALTPEKDAARNELVERLAASVYKQGEQARAAGKLREAVGHFDRVAAVAPQSTRARHAQYDAAAALIGAEGLGRRGALAGRLPPALPEPPAAGRGRRQARAWPTSEKGQWAQAAGEFERLAATNKDPQVARDALWQAAELYEKARRRVRRGARKAYERYLKQYPEPLETALEARYRLAQMAKADGNAAREFALMKEIYQADQTGGARAHRPHALPRCDWPRWRWPSRLAEAYRKVALVEPLAKQLKLKKAKMEEVLKAYAAAADYGVAEVTTAATYHTAALYQDFGKALMTSQRPKKLNKAELEQYNVMLEEQAFPFEEKATELHEINAKRAASGIYDKWVQEQLHRAGRVAAGALRQDRSAVKA